MQAELSRGLFKESVIQMMASFDMEWLVEVESTDGLRPVGMILADYSFGSTGIEPHIEWFPWATPRNKLEVTVRFLKEMGRIFKIFVYPHTDEQLLLWHRVWQYKVIKHGCKITDCYGRGVDAVMYYTPGPF